METMFIVKFPQTVIQFIFINNNLGFFLLPVLSVSPTLVVLGNLDRFQYSLRSQYCAEMSTTDERSKRQCRQLHWRGKPI